MTKRFILALLFSCSPLWATTYYVDNCVTVGNDRNNGTSTSTPWLTVAKVNSGSPTLNAGDSVLFESTCTWRESLYVPSSGSAGSPITFGAYGTGAAPIISGANLFTSWTLSSGSVYYTSYSTAPNQVFEDGSRLTQNTVSSASLTAGQWYLDTGATRIWVYLTAGDSPTGHTMEASVRALSVALSGVSYVTIQNLNLTKAMTDDLYLSGASNYNQLLNSSISYGGGGAGDGCVAWMGGSNGLIQANVISHCASDGVFVSSYDAATANLVIQFNDISWFSQSHNDTDGVHTWECGTGNIIRFNRIHNGGVAGASGHGIEIDTSSGAASVYSNLIFSNSIGCIWEGSGNPSSIYNNTCYQNGLVPVTGWGELVTFGPATGVSFENNLVVASTGEPYVIGLTGNSFNFNDYYGSSSSTPFSWNGTSYDFSYWKTTLGQDANSLNSAPTFASAGSQFWLLSASPAIAAGTNVGSPYNIGLLPGSTWPAGVTTGPANTPPDIGAFVYVPPVALNPPSNLVVSVH